MKPTTKAILALSALLLTSLFINAYLYFSIQKPDDQAFGDLLKEVDTRHAHETQKLKSSHAEEVFTFQAEIAVEYDTQESKIISLSQSLSAIRKQRRVQVQSDDTKLSEAIFKVGISDKAGVHVSNKVTITKPSALEMLDYVWKLQDDLKICDESCELRLIEQKEELILPGILARQAAEINFNRCMNGKEKCILRLRNCESKLVSASADVLKWSLISGAVGIIVGGAATGGFYYYVQTR